MKPEYLKELDDIDGLSPFYSFKVSDKIALARLMKSNFTKFVKHLIAFLQNNDEMDHTQSYHVEQIGEFVAAITAQKTLDDIIARLDAEKTPKGSDVSYIEACKFFSIGVSNYRKHPDAKEANANRDSFIFTIVKPDGTISEETVPI